jgi:hypothetical protein
MLYLLWLIAQLVLIVSGLIFMFWSLREKRAEAPRFPSFNPRLWFTPIWKQRDWFTPSGYRKLVIGSRLMGLGLLMGLVTLLREFLG